MSTIDLGDLTKYLRWIGTGGLKRAGEAGVEKAAKRAVLYLHARTAGEKIYDRGYFLNGWAMQNLGPGVRRVYNTAPHAIFVEMGRSAGRRRPPTQPIFEWLVRRGVSVEEAQRMAYPVAKAIGQRGIQARPVLNTESTMNAIRTFLVQSVLESIGDELKKTRP